MGEMGNDQRYEVTPTASLHDDATVPGPPQPTGQGLQDKPPSLPPKQEVGGRKEGEGGRNRAEKQNKLCYSHLRLRPSLLCGEWLFPGLAGEAWRDGKGKRGEGRKEMVQTNVYSSLNRFQRLQRVMGMKAALGPLPASSSAMSKLQALCLSGCRLPCYTENSVKYTAI